MHQGQGAVQRRLIAILEENGKLLDTFELAAGAYRVEPDAAGQISLSAAQLVSVRRALRGLVNQGAIADLGRHWHNGRQRWASLPAAKQYRQRTRKAFGGSNFPGA